MGDLGGIHAFDCRSNIERAAYRTAPRSIVTKAQGMSVRHANLEAAAGKEVT